MEFTCEAIWSWAATSWLRPSPADQMRPHPRGRWKQQRARARFIVCGHVEAGRAQAPGPGPGSASTSARGWGHGVLKKHSIKRNLGGAGNYQVVEVTQGTEKIEFYRRSFKMVEE